MGSNSDNTNAWQNFIRALKYLRPYWHIEILALICAIITSFLGLVRPWVNKLMVDDVIIDKNARMLAVACGIAVSASVLNAIFSTLRGYLFTYIGEKAIIDMRDNLFSHLQTLSMSFFNKEKTGKLMSIFTNDVPAMRELYTSTLVDFITDTLRFFVTIGFMLYLDWKLTLIALPTLPFFGVALALFARPVRRVSRQVQEKRSIISENLQESISGTREVKAFTQEKSEISRMKDIFSQILGFRLKQSILHSSSGGIAELTAVSGVMLVLWFGGLKAIRGDIQMGVLIAFINYQGTLFAPIARYMQLSNRIQGAMGAAERVFGFLDTRPEIQDKPHAEELPPISGGVTFKDVCFAYEADNQVLTDISLKVSPGEMIALVGPSGSGKTTMANLIPRFFDPIVGDIHMDNYNLKDVKVESLRKQIGMVFQESFLFAASIKDNIRFGKPDASDEEVIEAAKAANIHDFITQLPEGYETEVGERGVKLSGGQKQRISIARTIIRNPRILILDEATSALDSESEMLVQEALEKLMESRTTFVIAHRLSTVLKADRIVVLDNGVMVQLGSHMELINQEGLYKKLYEAQIGGMLRDNNRNG
ncbi:ATP-binding cassette domain-containing protein [Candidatus Poribacteria bacterium]|nr:ATP-binding cassette domain-containing protein [Candidatus Poribacteria bacterium]